MTAHQSRTASATGEDATSPRYKVEAIARAAQILDCLESGPHHEIAAIASRSEATEAFTEAALAALERRGLAHEDRGAWSLGLAWLQLAATARRQIDLREIALPIMRRMRDDVDETIILSVPRDKRRVNVEFMESTQEVRRLTQPGQEIPLYVGAAGRALLTGFPSHELRDYLASVAAADGMVICGLDVATYAQQVEAAGRSGFAVSNREFSADLCAISSPVLDHAGRVVAAVTISYPADRFSQEREDRFSNVTIAGAMDISLQIGFAG